MKKIAVFLALLLTCSTFANSSNLEKYISSFNYAARKEMKMHSKTLIKLMKSKRILLVDIRFPEEYKAWNTIQSTSIPINQLPQK